MYPSEAAQVQGPRRLWLMLAGVAAAACSSSTTVDLLPDSGGAPLGLGGTPTADSSTAACPAPVGAAGASVVAGLRNRYDFSGTGTTLCDLAEGWNGTVHAGAALDGSGTLSLDGVDDYVELPAGMVRRFVSVTLAAWFTWQDNRSWTRVFDFGQTAVDAADGGLARALFFFTPKPSNEPGPATGFSIDGSAFVYALGPDPFPADVEQQVAVVVDGAANPPTLTSYVQGVQVGQAQLPSPPQNSKSILSELWDQNCWLGQSQQAWDAHMTGVYDEFRIYDRALTQPEIQALLAAGPDQP